MSELFYLGKTDSFTSSSFRLYVDRGSSDVAAIVEERYYLFETTYDGGEPTRTPNITCSSNFSIGISTLLFENLPQNKNYWIYAWREYTIPSGMGTIKATQRSSTTSSPNGETSPGMTLIESVTVDPSSVSRVLSLTNLEPFNTEWVSRHSHYTVGTDSASGTDYVRLDIEKSPFGGWLVTKARYNKNKPINIKAKIKPIGNAAGWIPWGCMDLFSDNTDDTGITWRQNGGGQLCHVANLPWTDMGSKVTDYEDFEIDYNPDANSGAGLITYRARLNGSPSWVTLAQQTWRFTADPYLALVANYEGCASWNGSSFVGDLAGVKIDWGNIRIQAEEVFGVSGGWNMRWPTTTQCTLSYGPEQGIGYDWNNSYHFHEQGGGLNLARANSPAAVFNDIDIVAADSQPTFHLSTNSEAWTPFISPATNYKYKSLRLIGSTRSGGILKVQVYRKGSLVPDSEISGNSSGFTPSYKSEMVIDLQNVLRGPICVKTYGSNPTEGIKDCNGAYTGLLQVDWDWDEGEPIYENIYDNTGPPILKQLVVDFTPGALSVDVAIPGLSTSGSIDSLGATIKATMLLGNTYSSGSSPAISGNTSVVVAIYANQAGASCTSLSSTAYFKALLTNITSNAAISGIASLSSSFIVSILKDIIAEGCIANSSISVASSDFIMIVLPSVSGYCEIIGIEGVAVSGAVSRNINRIVDKNGHTIKVCFWTGAGLQDLQFQL